MNNVNELLYEVSAEFLEGMQQGDDFIFSNAVDELVRCYHKLKKGEEPHYKGHDLTESELTSNCPPLAENLTLESLEYHRERDRGVLKLIIISAMQLGMNQGLKNGKSKGRTLLAAKLVNLINKEKFEK